MAETALDGVKKELSIAYEDTHATPAASEGIVYFKTDGVPYAKSADMAETDLTGGSVAPVGATYITQTADATLTNEQALSIEPTGDLMVTTSTGVLNSIKHNLAASVAPDANDDSGDGYEVGSRWIDTTADKSYQCVDATLTAAVWNDLSAASSSPTTTRGDIIRRGASADERLALGTSEQMYESDGTDVVVVSPYPIRFLATGTLGSSAASVTISGWAAGSSAYEYMILRVNQIESDAAGTTNDNVLVTFNADTTATNYVTPRVIASSTGVAYNETIGTAVGIVLQRAAVAALSDTNHFATARLTIFEPESTSVYRNMLFDAINSSNTATELAVLQGGGTWRNNTNAITSITLTPSAGSNFLAGLTWSLYGVYNA